MKSKKLMAATLVASLAAGNVASAFDLGNLPKTAIKTVAWAGLSLYSAKLTADNLDKARNFNVSRVFRTDGQVLSADRIENIKNLVRVAALFAATTYFANRLADAANSAGADALSGLDNLTGGSLSSLINLGKNGLDSALGLIGLN